MKKNSENYSPQNYKYVQNIIKTIFLNSAFEATYDESWYFDGELHPFWEFVYVVSGCVVAVGDNRIYELMPGDIIFHKPMEFHRMWAIDDIKPHVFVMAFQIEGSYVGAFENGVYSLNENQQKKINDLLTYLRENTLSGNTRESSNIDNFLENWKVPYVPQNVVNRLEAFLLSVLNEENLVVKNENVREEEKIHKEIISILAENIYGQITLDEIAKRCNISKSHLKRKFAEVSDIGIHKYFMKLKMAEAMKLLSEGHAINEISKRLDFSTPNYFSMVFKRETGVSPLAYKKNVMK